MRPVRFRLLLVVLFVVFSSSLFAQVAYYPPGPPASNLVPKPKRDQKAEAIVQAAIQAMGGEALIGQSQGWVVTGQFQHTTKAGDQTGTFVWQNAGSEFRTDSIWPTGTNTVASGHGKPAVSTAGTTKAMPIYVANAIFNQVLAGAVLLKEIQDPNCSIELGEPATLGSQSALVVTTAVKSTPVEAMITPQKWYFDSLSGLPIRVEYRMPALSGARYYLSSAADLSDYRNISGAVYPFRIVRSHRGQQSDIFTLQSVIPNSAIASSQFDLAIGGAK